MSAVPAAADEAALLLASGNAAELDEDRKKEEQQKILLLQQQLKEEQQLLLAGGRRPRSVLIFCTNNEHKLQELQKILGVHDALLLRTDMHLCELQASSPEAIAKAKCREALHLLQLQWKPEQLQQEAGSVPAPATVSRPLVLTEDTCLCFDALGGLPGPYVKWFLERAGPDALCKMLHGFDNRSACALCTLCVVELDTSVDSHNTRKRAEVKIFQGRTTGTIAREPRGPRTFGWDCIFQPDGHDKTFAEMDKETKNSISHRCKAVEQLRAYIRERNESLRHYQ